MGVGKSKMDDTPPAYQEKGCIPKQTGPVSKQVKELNTLYMVNDEEIIKEIEKDIFNCLRFAKYSNYANVSIKESKVDPFIELDFDNMIHLTKNTREKLQQLNWNTRIKDYFYLHHCIVLEFPTNSSKWKAKIPIPPTSIEESK